MDARPGVISAPPTVPSQWPLASRPSNILASTCTRCGRATVEPVNIWNICGSCAAGGPRTGPSTIKQHPTTNCTACRVPLGIASHYHTAHVLCPPCQALNAAIVKTNPRDRAVPRANPYPVVLPTEKTTPRALALALAFTYPNLPVPSPTTASAGGRVHTSVNHCQDVLRICMRFECGARLPAHVLGDVCEACAGAGFVRPPPTVVQKHVPRRATQRTCSRPRESLDIVRASLLREAAHGPMITTKRKVVENESEVELVYPDDIPAAAQYPSTTESNRAESKPIDDEDVELELELMYPEDAANTTWTSSSKPQTKPPSPPTTLRELFKDGLQTIPALQNVAALADRSPPRLCRMPGCNEVLPPQTCMQRCVKCSISDWKRRKLAAKDTFDPLRRPTTDSSTEEGRVTNALDEISDIEDGSDLPPPPPPPPPTSSPGKGTSDELTGDHDVSSTPSWDSDLTELSSSDSDVGSMSNSDPEPDPRLASPHGSTTGLRLRVPLLVTRLPPGSLLRKCGNKKCHIALPKDHRWKTCDPCRRAQRIRFENERRSMMATQSLKSPNLSCRRLRSLSPDMHENDVTLTPETSRPCSTRHCQNRVPLFEVYQWKTCTSCRARTRREARQKRGALLETQHASCLHEIVPRFTAYQNRGALLSSFDAQLKGFVEGQIMYFRAKLHDSEGKSQAKSEPWKIEHTPMIFVFVGEYSVVTGQRGNSSYDRDHSRWPDKPAALDAMRQEVSSIVLDLECVLRAKFRVGEAFAIDKGGIIMRFTCSLELIAQLRPLATTVDPGPVPPPPSDSEANANRGEDAPLTVKPPPSPPTVPLVTTFRGELEAVVVPDESHRLFHGRRTVLRYRMVG